MSNWNKRLADTLAESSYTKSSFAKAVGVSAPTVTDWINGDIKTLSADNAERICSVLGIDYRWLLKGKKKPSFEVREPGNANYHLTDIKKLPVVSWVAAGKLCDSPTPCLPGDAEEWVLCPFPHSDEAFGLKVVGDSMSPEYREGEYILIDPAVEPTHNRDVVVRTPDDKHTFKRLQITPEGNYLLALNPDHPDRKIKVPEGTQICGVVTASWQKR